MPGNTTQRNIRRAAELVAKADALLITVSAGMGVDSGLPDFRGTQGFWRAYPALGKLGLSFEEMAQPRWFEERPEMAWALMNGRGSRSCSSRLTTIGGSIGRTASEGLAVRGRR